MVSGVANVGEPGPQVAAEDGDHAAAEGVDRRPRRVAELVGCEQARKVGAQLRVQSREVSLGEGSVVGEVVLEVEGDDDRGVSRVGRGPRRDGAEPGPEPVGAGFPPPLDDPVPGLAVPDG